MARGHSCANCVMWSLPPGADMGVCEQHSGAPEDPPPKTFQPGMGLRLDTGAWETSRDSFCDWQVPIPAPGPPCPKCSHPTVEGFGLAGGGYDAYVYCEAPGCDYFEKWREFGEEDAGNMTPQSPPPPADAQGGEEMGASRAESGGSPPAAAKSDSHNHSEGEDL